MSVIFYESEKFEKIGATLAVLRSDEFGRSIRRALSNGSHWDHGPTKEKIEEFVKDLQVANADCFVGQYEEIPAVEPLNCWRHLPLSHIQLIKSLNGLSYNLIDNGGKEYSHNGCYKKLEQLRNALAHHIVSNLTQYESAKTW